MKLFIAAAFLACTASATFFKPGSVPTCHIDSNGHTVVHFDRTLHPSFHCSHNAAKTKCSCIQHPTHHFGGCKSFVHTDGTHHNVLGKCDHTGENPVDCVGSWSAYGACSKTCGAGLKERTYTVTTPKNFNGKACPFANGAKQSAACNLKTCYTCTCSNGTPLNGAECDAYGKSKGTVNSAICKSCNNGHLLVDGACYRHKTCTCSNGTPLAGDACTIHAAKNGGSTTICGSCNVQYELKNGGCSLKSCTWIKVTPSMITQTLNEGTVTTIKPSNGGTKITVDANQGGCGRGDGSAATHYVSGNWQKIRYKEEFDGHASCWAIFGNCGYQGNESKCPNLHTLDKSAGDTITGVHDMEDVHLGGSKTRRCDNANDNFWHYASGMAGAARATVTLRRDDYSAKAGLFTGTSCTNTNNNFWHYSNIEVCTSDPQPKACNWVTVTPSMITKTLNEGTVTKISKASNGGAKITVDANQGGCGRGDGSAATHYISGKWRKIRYKQEFDGHASCWAIFGNCGYQGNESKCPNLHTLDPSVGDIITDVHDMEDVHLGGSKTRRCDNANDNFWHYASGMAGAARGTVELRRDDLNKEAGLFTGTSCTNTGNNFWHYSNIQVCM